MSKTTKRYRGYMTAGAREYASGLLTEAVAMGLTVSVQNPAPWKHKGAAWKIERSQDVEAIMAKIGKFQWDVLAFFREGEEISRVLLSYSKCKGDEEITVQAR